MEKGLCILKQYVKNLPFDKLFGLYKQANKRLHNQEKLYIENNCAVYPKGMAANREEANIFNDEINNRVKKGVF